MAFDWGVPFLNAGHSDAAVVGKDHDSKHRGRYSRLVLVRIVSRGGVRGVGGFGRVRDCADHRRHCEMFLYSAVSSSALFVLFELFVVRCFLIL